MIRTHLLIATAAVVLAACGAGEPPRPDHEVVAERAQARWDALLAGDFAAALEFHTPAFRERTPVEAYRADMSNRPVRWVSAEPRAATCEDDRCTMEMLVGYRLSSGPAQLSGMGNQRPIEETWVRIDDNWWYVPGD
ncbi:hypothetical protein [Halomonas denitrificans]|nr:hypothetical protein [Halomonas denitrificans]